MIIAQALLATSRRPGRSMLTAIGVALGITVFIVTIGMSSSVNSQINANFDVLLATTITVRDAKADGDSQASEVTDADPMKDRSFFSGSFDTEVAHLNGVVAGGELWTADSGRAIVSSGVDKRAGETRMSVVVATPGAFEAAEIPLASGRIYDLALAETVGSQCILGPSAANSLGIPMVSEGLAVNVNGRSIIVAGILAGYGGLPSLDDAVIVLPATAESLYGAQPEAGRSAIVRTEIGAAISVAKELPYLLHPDNTARVAVALPPDPDALRGSVQESLNGLALAAAFLSLFIGGVGIMNAMLTSVTQRSGEIGLRRALGAKRRHIIAQFIFEGIGLGLLGGLLGAVVGVIGLAGVCAWNDWTPVITRELVWLSPLGGLVVGFLASIYPAVRASQFLPAEALRQ